jgi:hypothetical protein
MGRVSWSDQAKADLAGISRALRYQLRRNAEMILHPIPPCTDPADEGADGEIMWHRADGHGRFTKRANGPQDYFLFYRCHHAPGSEDPEFEILAVCSIRQVASMWGQIADRASADPQGAEGPPPLSSASWS